MLQLIQDVYPYLLAFYLFESLLWVRSGALALVAWRPGRFRLQPPGVSLRGLVPSAEVLITGTRPIAIESDAVVYRKTPRRRRGMATEREEWVRLGYDAISTVARQGRRVVLNGRIEIAAPSAGIARHLVILLDRLRRAPASQRPQVVAATRDAAVDLDAFRELRRRHAPTLRRLRVLSSIAAALFLGAIPACLYSPDGLGRPLLVLVLPALLAIHTAVALTSGRLLRSNGFGWADALEALAPGWLFPPASAHAASVVLRELYAEFAAATMAAALLDAETLAVHADQELAHLAHTRARRSGLALAAIEDSERTWQRVLATLPGPDPFAALPRRSDPTAAAFCPLCRCEYRAGFARCTDCDETLRPFGEDATSAA